MPFRLVINRNAVEVVPEAIRRNEPPRFHRELEGYEATPLRRLRSLERELDLDRVWVKDESRRFGLPAFKILGSSWAVHCATRGADGERPTPRRLVAATDGNHGRSVAHLARRRGLAARIFVPCDTVADRIDGIRSEGAQVEVVEGGYDATVVAAAAACGQDDLLVQDTGWPGYETIPRRIVEGYATLFHEISESLSRSSEPEPTSVWIPFGVGSLAAAAVDHYRGAPETRHVRLVGVEPLDAACGLESLERDERVTVGPPHRSIMAGLNCGTISTVAWNRLRHGLDAAVAVSDAAAERAMRDLAGCDIVSGESGAAALAGLRATLERVDRSNRERLGLGTAGRVLLLSTEGITDREGYRRVVGRAW